MPWFKGDASHTSKKTLFSQDTFTIWIKIYNDKMYRIKTLQIMTVYNTNISSRANTSDYRLRIKQYE